MGKEDYTAAGGGALKLKGAKPTGIDKKRKKKPKPSASASDSARAHSASAEPAGEESKDYTEALRDEMEELRKEQEGKLEVMHKTEAERRHEEMRRKRLDERLKREGIKTHKERVEELNKYLSNLSEHHDMPRIGPG